MAAPVCHVPTPGAEADPNSSGQSSGLATIPPAQPNIASMMRTLNALRQVVNKMNGKDPDNRNRSTTYGMTSSNSNKKPQWSEVSRKTEKVKVYQGNDKDSENWVEIEQINQLVMQNKNDGQKWEWNRKKG